MNIKDITIPLIIYLLFTESIQNAQIFYTLNHNVRFLPCRAGRWRTMRVRAKPCVHRFNYSRTLREVPRRGCGHS